MADRDPASPTSGGSAAAELATAAKAGVAPGRVERAAWRSALRAADPEAVACEELPSLRHGRPPATAVGPLVNQRVAGMRE